MSSVLINEVRRGVYLDSVALMRLSRTIAQMDGIEEAALMVGTPANCQIMADAGLLGPEGEAAGGGDLIIGIRASTAAAGDAAMDEARRLLDQPTGRTGGGDAWRPRTIRSAVAAQPGTNLALISVPGDFAAAEARKALRRNLHVMLFSDNVSLADELSLKREGLERGLLVMGPDCGTAIINGVPLAFANKVPRGDIAIIGASGTGTQEISCLIAQGGGGVSQAIGVGGRDLKPEIGGITTMMALEALDRDPQTRHIVLVSKPPAADVAARIFDRITLSRKSFTVCFLGAADLDLPGNTGFAPTLKSAAEHALGGMPICATFDATSAAKVVAPARRHVMGLFAGGTLCGEAQAVFLAAGEVVASNAPVPGAVELEQAGGGHKLIDLGADEFTRGRPHPMIDPGVRDDALRTALADRSVGVVLVDVVIGYGAHDDPAGHLVGCLDAGGRDRPVVVASVTGTDADPQSRALQVAKLTAAGVIVAPCNADAARVAVACLGERG